MGIGPTQVRIASSRALYRALLPPFRAFHPALSNLTILDRKPISRTRSLVLVRATVPSIERLQPRQPEDFRQESFGLFVLEASSDSLWLTVTRELPAATAPPLIVRWR